jgi:DNA polymerase III delta subunit
MLYAFYGSDVVRVRQKAHEFLDTYEEKGVTVERISPENYVAGSIEDAAGSASLFVGVQVYVIDTPSGDTEMFERVFGVLDMLKESDNTFVLIEEGLLAAQKKVLQKYAETCVELTKVKDARFNAFSLADAFAARDKKSLWMLLLEARRNGLSAEEIIGTLYWQVKALRLATITKHASEAGMKDFPYNKAKRALTKFGKGDIERLSRELLSIYHDGHAGTRDIDIALETWTLKL